MDSRERPRAIAKFKHPCQRLGDTSSSLIIKPQDNTCNTFTLDTLIGAHDTVPLEGYVGRVLRNGPPEEVAPLVGSVTKCHDRDFSHIWRLMTDNDDCSYDPGRS